jgi:multiple sugar transport system substrate-binding protein
MNPFLLLQCCQAGEAGFTEPPKTWDELTTRAWLLSSRVWWNTVFAPFWNQDWSLGNEFHFWTYAFGGELWMKTAAS